MKYTDTQRLDWLEANTINQSTVGKIFWEDDFNDGYRAAIDRAMGAPSPESTGDNVPSGKTLPQIEEQLREAFREGHRCGADAYYNYMEAMNEHGQPISLEEWEEKDWEESEAKKGL